MKATIPMKRDKECKHSIRFATDDDKALIQNVYVQRTPEIEKADKITVTIEV